MADHIITGKVHFAPINDIDELADRLEKAAHEYGIHTQFADFTCDDNILSFTVTDSPESEECDRIISGITFRAIDFSMADVSETGLPDVERFLTAVMSYPEITMIEIDFDHAHGSNLRKYEIVTEANHFCFAVMHTPNHGHTLPTATFRIYHSEEFGAPQQITTEGTAVSPAPCELADDARDKNNFDYLICFARMAELSCDIFDAYQDKQHYTQVVCLRTAGGRIYSTVIPNAIDEDHVVERELLSKMKDDGNTRITEILCSWGDSPDFPSYDFREMMLELDPANADAKMLLRDSSFYHIRTVGETMR